MAKRNLKKFPTLITYVDAKGKEHAPPDPPLREGCPPWLSLPNEYLRDQPLPHCPVVKCRRARNCLSPLYGKFCQRTHLEADVYRGLLADKLEALQLSWRNEDSENIANQTCVEGDGLRELKQALTLRENELGREELLKWQTNWVREQERSAQASKDKAHFSPSNPKITSC